MSERDRYRAFAMRVSSAVWGVAAGIEIARRMQHRAPADALPSAMTALQLDAGVPVLQVLIIVCCSFLAAAAGAVWSRRVRDGWSFHLTWIALAAAPLTVIAGGRLPHLVVHALAAGAATALGFQRPRFTRTDVILVPTTIALYFAALGIAPAAKPVTVFLASILVVLAVRIVAGMLTSHRRPARAFALAPIAILCPVAWLSVAWIVVTPILLARIQRVVPQKLVAIAIYPLFIAIYPLVLLGVSAPPHLDFFEDGHHLLPASEMSRGERPYADIVPVHGLLSDGGIETVLIKMGYTDAGSLLRARRIISCTNLVAIYLVGLAATASMEVGFLAAAFAVCAVPSGTIWIRSIGGILALAAALAGVRTQRPRWLGLAGALVVVAGLFGLEFGVYSGIAGVIAATRMRQRLRALRWLAVGFLSAAIVVTIAFAAAGAATAFLRVPLTELLPAGRVYVPGPLAAPAAWTSFANIVSNSTAAQSLPALLWLIAVVTSAAMLTRRPSRADGPWLIGVWIAVAAVSYAQRQHEYFIFLLGPFVVGALVSLRRVHRGAFVALAVIAGVLANPMQHVFGVATPLRKSGSAVPGDVLLTATPRAHGVTAPAEVGAGVAAARRFVSSELEAGETWFDFANAGALYYLLDRDCPTRHHQVPFYETTAGQREVIAAVSSNPKVVAVLLAFPGGMSHIDGISNSERAPLVAEFIRSRFRPAFDEHGVVFWLRR